MKFFLGTHRPQHLARTSVPLFVSARTLRGRRSFPVALGQWALDSGGFSELSLFGAWKTTPEQYASEARMWQSEIGGLQWAAIQDWMCEPFIIAKTGLSVSKHQILSRDSLLRLRHLAPEVPWAPVLQGWTLDDYLRHVDMYFSAGVILVDEPIVGVGSICRRQGTMEAEKILRTLSGFGIRLHAFGAKTTGLVRYHDAISSADSLAWSYHARRRPPMDGHRHKNCANCLEYALMWRSKLLSRMNQRDLFARMEVT